jgi:phytoene dehydrogenase-like protein
MGLNKNLKTLGNDAYSTFILPSRLRRFKDFSKFTSSTSNLDQKVLTLVDYGQVDSRLTPDGKSVATCTIIDHIDNWEHLDPKAYAERKESVSQEVLTALEKHMPGIRNAVEYYEAATPLTMRRYTLNPDGCIYGYAQINSQIGPRRPDIFSRIPGLYFASAWSKPGGGITPAAKCGYTAACAILEKN